MIPANRKYVVMCRSFEPGKWLAYAATESYDTAFDLADECAEKSPFGEAFVFNVTNPKNSFEIGSVSK